MKQVFCDYAATCPTAPEVVEAMAGLWMCANPASEHAAGRVADDAVSEARGELARLINASPEEIIFTSGATESNNLAVKGFALASTGCWLLASATEHKSVLRSIAWATGDAPFLSVKPSGELPLDSLADRLRQLKPKRGAALVSVQAVNNETGVIQPVRQVADVCARFGAVFHCDAAQALGRLRLDVEAMGVDMMSLSAHKAYGPKGIGALYVRNGLKLEPLLHGGRQEGGRRAGTSSPPLVVGFVTAAKLAEKRREYEDAALGGLRAQLLSDLEQRRVRFRVNGHDDGAWCVPGIISVAFPGNDPERTLIEARRNLCCSAGAACGLDGPSHVLNAMGAPLASLRISLGRWTTGDDIACIANALERAARAGAP